jgi:hypothetical protein
MESLSECGPSSHAPPFEGRACVVVMHLRSLRRILWRGAGYEQLLPLSLPHQAR